MAVMPPKSAETERSLRARADFIITDTERRRTTPSPRQQLTRSRLKGNAAPRCICEHLSLPPRCPRPAGSWFGLLPFAELEQ